MFRLGAIGATVLVLLASTAAAVEVRIDGGPAAPRCLANAVLLATAGDRQQRLKVKPNETLYDLPITGNDVWELRIDAPECWSETVTSSAATQRQIRIAVRPVATVTGTVNTDGTGPVPHTFEAFVFRRPSEQLSQSDLADIQGMPTSCRFRFPHWECDVPRNEVFDLRIASPAFADVYLWSLLVHDREETVQPIHLVRGGSISGWVRTSDGAPIADARIVVSPAPVESLRQEQRTNKEQERSANTDKRGFFQIAGLQPGMYSLRSDAKGWSPAAISQIRVRPYESVVWPNPIVHRDYGSLDVTLYPPVDPAGAPWTLELWQQNAVRENIRLFGRSADVSGHWEATHLPTGAYWLTVRDTAGSELLTADVDLAEGGKQILNLAVRSIAVRGTVHIGDKSIAADILFMNAAGKTVRATSSDDGDFLVKFPVAGEWTPAIRYPRTTGSKIRLARIKLDPGLDGPPVIDLNVPGGRIHGEVVTQDGSPQKALVHVTRDGNIVARMTTADDGQFDFIGLAAGAYLVDASTAEASTPRPSETTVDKENSDDLRLVLARLRHIHGQIVTPDGAPASGAVVHVLTDGGRGWDTVEANVEGQFEYRLPAGTTDVALVVLTYDYPSALLRVPPDVESLSISLKPVGAMVGVRNGRIPYIRTPLVAAPLRAFYFPEPLGRFNGLVFLEPGMYAICPDRAMDSSCKTIALSAGTETAVDFKDRASNGGEK